MRRLSTFCAALAAASASAQVIMSAGYSEYDADRLWPLYTNTGTLGTTYLGWAVYVPPGAVYTLSNIDIFWRAPSASVFQIQAYVCPNSPSGPSASMCTAGGAPYAMAEIQVPQTPSWSFTSFPVGAGALYLRQGSFTLKASAGAYHLIIVKGRANYNAVEFALSTSRPFPLAPGSDFVSMGISRDSGVTWSFNEPSFLDASGNKLYSVWALRGSVSTSASTSGGTTAGVSPSPYVANSMSPTPTASVTRGVSATPTSTGSRSRTPMATASRTPASPSPSPSKIATANTALTVSLTYYGVDAGAIQSSTAYQTSLSTAVATDLSSWTATQINQNVDYSSIYVSLTAYRAGTYYYGFRRRLGESHGASEGEGEARELQGPGMITSPVDVLIATARIPAFVPDAATGAAVINLMTSDLATAASSSQWLVQSLATLSDMGTPADANIAGTPMATALPSPTPSASGAGLGGGAVAGIVIGGIAALGVVLAAAVVVRRRRAHVITRLASSRVLNPVLVVTQK